MEKRKKVTLIIFMTALLIPVMLWFGNTGSVFAETFYGTFDEDGNRYYRSDVTEKNVPDTYDGGVGLSIYGGSESELVIPQTVTHDGKTYLVTAIGEDIITHKDSLQKVTIHEFIRDVGPKAFVNCDNLKEIVVMSASNSSYYYDHCIGYNMEYDEEDEEIFTPIEGVKIYGYTDSPIDTYASTNGFTFETMGSIIRDANITYKTPTLYANNKIKIKDFLAELENRVNKDSGYSTHLDISYCGIAIKDGTDYTHTRINSIKGLDDSTFDDSKEYYLLFNIEDDADFVFPVYDYPAVTVNGLSVDDMDWYSQSPDGSINVYKKLAFTSSDVVYSVAVSPKDKALQKGTGFQFDSSVIGTDSKVTWSVLGNSSTSTTVSSTGFLSIGTDETSSSIILRATSVVDTSIYGEVEVEVTDSAVGIDSVKIYPESIDLYRASDKYFSVTVTGNELKDVTWSVSGNNHADTAIISSDNKEAKLYVSVDESSDTIYVTATSVYDPSKYDTATVHLKNKSFISDILISFDETNVFLAEDVSYKTFIDRLIESLEDKSGNDTHIDKNYSGLAVKDGSSYTRYKSNTPGVESLFFNKTDEYYLYFNVEEDYEYWFDTGNLPDITINGFPADDTEWYSETFDGSLDVFFKIDFRNVNDAKATIPDQEYCGSELTPEPELTYHGLPMVKGTDYEIISYNKNKEAGKAEIKIAGKGIYSGTTVIEFNIVPIDISDAKVSAVSDYEYTGSAITPIPNVTGKIGGVESVLTNGVDYELSYEDNKEVGTAKIIIKGIGNFKGTKTVEFNIKPSAVSPTPTPGTTDPSATPTPDGTEPSATTTPGIEDKTVTPAEVGTTLTDSANNVTYKVISTGKTDAADPSKNEMPAVAFTGTTDKKAKKFNIGDTVKFGDVIYNIESIGEGALKNNKKITSLTIGKNVKVIEKNAFAGCTKLKTVNCKSKVLYKIGANAFKGDKKLTKITLKTSLLKKKNVGKNAIKGTSKKLKIYAPKKMKKSYQKLFRAKGNKKVKTK